MTDTAEDFLEHYGVKGMKWGVRRDRRLSRARRVARGTASKKDKTIFALTDTSAKSIKKNDGLAGAARVRANELARRKKRINEGRATVKDLIALNGGDRLLITGNPDVAKDK